MKVVRVHQTAELFSAQHPQQMLEPLTQIQMRLYRILDPLAEGRITV
jgi:hypothetical protein